MQCSDTGNSSNSSSDTGNSSNSHRHSNTVNSIVCIVTGAELVFAFLGKLLV